MSTVGQSFRRLDPETFNFRLSDGSPVRTLQTILRDPILSSAPAAVVPHLAWVGRTTLLSAREKLGKSTLAGAAAAAVSAGRPFLGGATLAGPVIWMGLEEHISDSARRLAQFHAEDTQVVLLPQLPSDSEDIERLVARVKPGLVVIDTLSAFASGTITDAASSAQWVPVMQSLTSIARTFNPAVLILHHAGKAKSGYRDSSAIGAGVDTLVEMQSGPRKSQRLLAAKGRLGPPEQITAEFAGHTFHRVGKEPDLVKAVLDHLGANPESGKREIREAVGGRGKAADEVLSQLVASGEVIVDRRLRKHAYSLAARNSPQGYESAIARGRVRTAHGHSGALAPTVSGPGSLEPEPDTLRQTPGPESSE